MALRNIIGPFHLVAIIMWLSYIFISSHYPDFTRNWFMSLTMLFGSFIAGATSEGGGAVAFPVMTLIFNISPAIARDFSLIIQSFGMSAASIVILSNKIAISKNFLKLALPASILGQLITVLFLKNYFSPVTLKIGFTSLWISYALVLSLYQNNELPQHDVKKEKSNAFIIFPFALIGGIVTALTGSGVDILTFAVATLYFKISVKIATPTSVVLMAINSVCGVLLKIFLTDGISNTAIDYWLVCLPIVILGAPLGALFITNKTSRFIIRFLQISIVAQFIFSWLILPLNFMHKILSVSIVVSGCFIFWKLQKHGPKSIDCAS